MNGTPYLIKTLTSSGFADTDYQFRNAHKEFLGRMRCTISAAAADKQAIVKADVLRQLETGGFEEDWKGWLGGKLVSTETEEEDFSEGGYSEEEDYSEEADFGEGEEEEEEGEEEEEDCMSNEKEVVIR
jgi:hypothetical protein